MKTIRSYTVGPVSFELLDTGEEIVLHVTEPPLSEEASLLYLELRDYFSRHLELDPSLEEDRWIAAERLGKTSLYEQWKSAVDYYLLRDYSGFGVIDPLMRDDNIEEIGVVGGDYVRVVHKDVTGWIRTNILVDEGDARILAQRLAVRVGESVSPLFPLREFNLDGNRVTIALGGSRVSPYTSITVRRLDRRLSLDDLVELRMLSRELATLLVEILRLYGMILVVGPQGSGKTTLVNALLDVLPEHMRIVTIEETPELRLSRGNWIPLYTRMIKSLDVAGEKASVGIGDLMRVALRMRSDVVAVTEARGAEVRYVFEAAALGSASIATFHAGSIGELERRLRLLGITDYYLDLVWAVVFTGITRNGRRILEVWSRERGRWELVAELDPVADEWTFTLAEGLMERIGRARRLLGIEEAQLG